MAIDKVEWRIRTWCEENPDFLDEFSNAAADYEDFHGESILLDPVAIETVFRGAGIGDIPFSAEDFAEYIAENDQLF